MWYAMSPMVRDNYIKKFSRCPIPVNAHLPPNRYFGSIPEKMSKRIGSFLESSSRNKDIARSDFIPPGASNMMGVQFKLTTFAKLDPLQLVQVISP